MTLLTPTQIIQQKPSIQNYFSPKQMGYLLWLGLVRGRQVSRTSYLCLEDIEELIEKKKSIKAVVNDGFAIADLTKSVRRSF